MTTYQFRSMLFRNSLEVAAAIAEAYLTACGMNSDSDIRGFFAESTDEEMADEAIERWGLLEIVNDNAMRYENVEPETWLESRGLDRAALVSAFANIRCQYPQGGCST